MKWLGTKNGLFVVCLLAFLTHLYLERIAALHIGILDSYLDPLLVMPLLLHLVVIERRLILNRANYRLPVNHLIGYVILLSIVGEVILPSLDGRFVTDPIDILFYALGAMLYTLWPELTKPSAVDNKG